MDESYTSSPINSNSAHARGETSIRVIIASIGLAWCSASFADVSVSLHARDEAATPFFVQLTQAGSPSATATLVNGGSLAFGFGNLSTGILRATGSSVQPESLIGYNVGFAAVQITDTFTFNAPEGYGGLAFLDWSFDGSIQTNPDKFAQGGSSGAFDITVTRFTTSIVADVGYELTNGACNPASTFCSTESSIALTGSVPIPVDFGPYSVTSSLTAGGANGDSASFGNTAKLYLRLPSGVTITSGSGTFLAEAAPILAVPEPSSFLMLALGVAAMVAVRVRRKSVA